MLKLFLAVILCASAWAQAPQIPASTPIEQTREAINAALATLDAAKVAYTTSSAPPISGSCTVPGGQLHVDIVALKVYVCGSSGWFQVQGATGGSGGAGSFGDLTGVPSDNSALNAALNLRALSTDLTGHTSRVDNPHGVTKTQIGLGSVANALQLQAGLNLSDLSNAVTARANLGLGAAATANVGTTAGTVAAGDHGHTAYSPLGHIHPASEITSGVFDHARLGTGGTGGGANVLWDDGTWHAPPGASGGEANTSSNAGTGGIGLVLPKSGTDLPFKSLYAGSTKVTLTDDAANKRISIDLDPSVIDHGTLANHGTNTHAQIDTHLGATNNPHGTTAAQVGAPALTLLTTLGDLPYRDGSGWQRLSASAGWLKWTGSAFTYSTPTKADVSLGNVDNTSDANKPVSTATQSALNLKADLASPVLTTPQIGAGGPKLKNESGTLAVRNAADNAYAPIKASQVTAGDGTAAGEVLLPETTANGTDYISWLAPAAITSTLRLRLPNANPAGQVLSCAAPSGGISDCTWVSAGGGTTKVLGYAASGTGSGGVLQDADITLDGAGVNDASAKTLTEASCISDTGSQAVTVKIGATTLFTITCVPKASYSRSTTNGTTGYINAASMGSTAVGAGAVLDVSGTANASTKVIALHAFGN